jgi:hypothetical protein
LNPESSTVFSHKNLHSRTDYSPYEGFKLNGAIEKVFLRGQLVAKRVKHNGMQAIAEDTGLFIKAESPTDFVEEPL